VTICHIPPGNPANAHSITVSLSALQAHLNHGDSLGPCPAVPAPRSFVDISVACGTVSNVTNSLGLPSEVISGDTSSSGLTGIRIWDIPNCDTHPAPLMITYDVCDNVCSPTFCPPLVGYGVGNCLQYEEAVMGSVSGNRLGQGGAGGKLEVQVFPNPTNSSFVVLATCVGCADPNGYELRIVDAMGRTVTSECLYLGAVAYQRTFDLGGYADGIYMVVVHNGAHSLVTRVVKQN
jgi:hypothetical protein